MSRWHLMTLAMKGIAAFTLRQKHHVTFTGATQLAMQNLNTAEPRSFASAPSTATQRDCDDSFMTGDNSMTN